MDEGILPAGTLSARLAGVQVLAQDNSVNERDLKRHLRIGEIVVRADPPRLLLAEDDAAFRFLLVSALRKDGYQIVAVSNGVDLIDILGDSLSRDGTLAPFHIVLSDVRMPGWPGLEGLARLSCNPAMPPFILFTSFGDEETHKRALDMGALTLLDKPFVFDFLRELVTQVLA